MAIFNPDVKDVSPQSYIGLSKATEGPRLISGAGLALKDAGNIVETAAKGTDQIISTLATNEASDLARTGRDAYIDALELSNKYASGQIPQPSGGSGKGQGAGGGDVPADNSLVGADTPDLPKDIQSLPQRAATLASAKDAGKISQTNFHGQIATLARDLRSRYGSAYWPIIDSTISSVIGVDPANAYIHGMVSQLNARKESGQNEMNKLIDAARKAYLEGDVSMKPVYEGLINGTADPIKAAQMISLSHSDKFAAESAEREFKLLEANGKLTKENWTRRFDATVSPRVMQFFRGATMGPEINGADPNSPITEEAAKVRGQALSAARERASQWMWAKAQKDGTIGSIGADEVGKRIEANLKPFDIALTSLNNKDFGAMNIVTRQIEAIKNNTTLSLLADKDMGVYYRHFYAMKELAPQFLADWTKSAITNGVLQESMKAYQQRLKSMITGQTDVKGNPSSTTFNTALDNYERDGVSSPNNLNDLVGLIDGGPKSSGLLDPKTSPEGKYNIAKAAFDTRNLGFISRLSEDKQLAVFRRMTSEDVAKEVEALDKVKPGTKQMYRNWVTQTFGGEIFGKEIKQLDNVDLSKSGVKLEWANNQGFSLNLKGNSNAELGRLVSTGGNTGYVEIGKSRIPVNYAEFKQAQQAINKINNGLSSIKTMYSVGGYKDSDVGAFIVRSLMQLGYNPNPNTPGLPDQIVESIRAAQKKAEETKKKWEGK